MKGVLPVSLMRYLPLPHACLAIALGLTSCTLLPSRTDQDQPVPNSTPAANVPINSKGIVRVVDQVGPAVVRINASRTTNGRSDPFFAPFEAPRERIERGTGSGFIFDANGLILTNAHVVDQADQVFVVLKDGQQFQGEVLGADPLTDVAVVKIDAPNLPAVKLGDSDNLLPGQWAIAIGNPLGLDNTVTVGIISATGRSSAQIGSPDQRVDFIQTDAAINPGNSGGPLLNVQGEVIGVNTAIISGAQGLGFAIPVSLANRIAQQLIRDGKVQHAYLGVRMADLTPELRERWQSLETERPFPEGKGVLIMQVVPDSPADRAGLRAGDLLTKVDDTPVQTSDQVQQVVAKTTPGDRLKVTVTRDTQPEILNVTVGTLTPSSFAEN